MVSSTTNHEPPSVLLAKGISKSFPGVKALDRVDFDLRRGEVHALVGENGAGKSTLMQILAGIYVRDEGSVHVDGSEQQLGTKRRAEEAGMSIVFQESSLLQNLSVCENLFSGDPPRTKMGLLDWKAMGETGSELLSNLTSMSIPWLRLNPYPQQPRN